MLEGRVIIMKDDKKENGYYFSRKGNNLLDDVDFDYLKWEEKDDEYIKKLNELNNTLINEKILEGVTEIDKLTEQMATLNITISEKRAEIEEMQKSLL